ncbi:MAG: hypothetical protein AAFQ89_16975 [Cyanobacteria bacterium J06626_18]
MEAIAAQVGDVGVGFGASLAIGPELKLVMFGVNGEIALQPDLYAGTR